MPAVLTSQRPRAGRPIRRRPPRILAALVWLTVPFFPLLCLFVMDYMNFAGDPERLSVFWQKHPGSVLFEVLVVLILFTLLLLLLRQVWVSALTFGALSLVCAYVNYMKVALNGDNFYPQDLAMVTSAGELTSFLSGDLPRRFWTCAALLLVWTVLFLAVRPALPRPFLFRWSAAAILVLVSYCATCIPALRESLFNRFGMSSFDSALQSSNYTANGFVGAFTLNALGMQISAPAGHDQEAMAELLDQYQAVPASQEPFDVVVVLNESFFDARILPGVTFSENPLSNYDRLLAHPRCQSGMMYTTALGGGTVRPEFSILTGLTTDYLPNVTTPYWYVTRDLPTYVSNYKEAGYTALALHPYDKKFYARNTAYPLLGFDAFYGQDEMAELTEVFWNRSYINDHTAAMAIQQLADSREEPVFLFTITMQNHQPYNAMEEGDIRVRVDSPDLTEPSLTALTTYTQGLYDADQMLGELVHWVDGRERPTVLVFFGDHLPTLGPNYLAYNETGFVDTSDGMDSEVRQKMYSTPFLIYSNRDLEPGLLNPGPGNQISDYNLLNTVARSTGMARTPYMELLADFYQTAPYWNVRLALPDTPEVSFFTRAMELVTYDRVLGKGWTK